MLLEFMDGLVEEHQQKDDLVSQILFKLRISSSRLQITDSESLTLAIS